MRYLLALLLVVISLKFSLGQVQFPFQPGEIEFSNGEVLKCEIQLALGYDSVVVYKLNRNASPKSVNVSDVKSLRTQISRFEKVILDDNEILMRVVTKGKASLYSHMFQGSPEQITVTINDTRIEPELSDASHMDIYVYYLIVLDNQKVVILKENFDQLIELLNDCKSVKKKLVSGKLTFENMEQIIKEFNKC